MNGGTANLSVSGAAPRHLPHHEAIHASAVAIGERALLILGPSKSGKSHLALALLGQPGAGMVPVKLIGDDRVILSRRDGTISVWPHPLIAGLIEKRGYGFLAMPHVGGVALGGIVRLQRGGDEPAPSSGLETWQHRGPGPGGEIPFLLLPREAPWDMRARTVLEWYTATLAAHPGEKPRARDLKSVKD